MAEETALIEKQMEETRKDLAEKVELLEKQVVATVKETTQAVTETVSSVTEAVQSTVGSVTDTVQKTAETVKETFDVRKQVEQHPWLAVGGAAAAGYLLGMLLTPRRAPGPSREREAEEGHESEEPRRAHHHEQAREEHTGEAACMGHPCGEEHQERAGLLGGMGDVVKKLTGMAIGATTGVIGEVIRSAVPEALRGDVSKAVDRFTTALGGTPIHSRNH